MVRMIVLMMMIVVMMTMVIVAMMMLIMMMTASMVMMIVVMMTVSMLMVMVMIVVMMMMMMIVMVMKLMSVSYQVLAEAHPSSLGFLWRSYEELYLLLDLLLQSHKLSSCSASFSENFYGLKRVPRAGGALSRGARGRSLLLLCLLPYVLRRLCNAVSRRRDQDDFSIPPAASAAGPRPHRLHHLLACGGQGWAILRLAQTLLYVAGRAQTHSPLLWLAGVRLTPLTARDLSLMRTERPGGATGSR